VLLDGMDFFTLHLISFIILQNKTVEPSSISLRSISFYHSLSIQT